MERLRLDASEWEETALDARRVADDYRAHAAAMTDGRDKALAVIERVRELCGNTGDYRARAKYLHCGSARLLAVEILAALDGA